MARKSATAAFQIRDFPVNLREEIVRVAKEADVPVSDFMVRVCMAAAADGWARVAAVEPDLYRPAAPEPGLGELVTAAVQLSGGSGVPLALRRLAQRAVRERLARLTGAAVPGPRSRGAQGRFITAETKGE